uniref:Putative bpti/kunitz family of serine protease inhibitor n=1 Tax=Ixodes ricinus TaxID=34613 RepID=V5GH78_IXORI
MKSALFLLCSLLFLKMIVVTKAQKNELCSQPPLRGPCSASLQRFFYDPPAGRCRLFIYGGCEGNLNRFRTLEECRRTC